MERSERKALAFVRGREALLWDADDAVWLRREWRIVGSLVGAAAHQPRQNVRLGLPLVLTPDEVSLLLQHGALDLRMYSPQTFSAADEVEFQKLRQEDFEQQLLLYHERREESRQKHTGKSSDREAVEEEKEARERLAKEEERGKAAKKPKLEEKDITDASFTAFRPPQAPSSFTPLVCLHTSDSCSSLHPSCFEPAQWTYPNNEQEELHFAVFCALWRRGYYITSGLKYGGDFLVYDGDPAMVHSMYIAVVLPWQQTISSSSLVSWGRLGSKVRKNTLFCSMDSSGDLKLFTLQWSGAS